MKFYLETKKKAGTTQIIVSTKKERCKVVETTV